MRFTFEQFLTQPGVPFSDIYCLTEKQSNVVLTRLNYTNGIEAKIRMRNFELNLVNEKFKN